MQKKQKIGKKAKQFFKEQGKIGGNKTKEKGTSYFSELGKKGASKRWGNKNKTHDTDKTIL